MADAPSTVVAQKQINEVAIEPNGRVEFQVEAPDVESGRALSLRVHVNLDGSQQVKPGDLLTTSSYPIPTSGPHGRMTVPVKLV